MNLYLGKNRVRRPVRGGELRLEAGPPRIEFAGMAAGRLVPAESCTSQKPMALQPIDPLYERAKLVLRVEPDMGKKRLAQALGVRTPTSRLLRERFWGETRGHSIDPIYQRVCQVKSMHPDWGASRVADALGMTLDRAKLYLARWIGVQVWLQAGSSGPSAPATPPSDSPAPSSPPPSAQQPAPPPMMDASAPTNEFEDSVHGEDRSLCSRGDRIRTLEDLLVLAQVDTRVWFVERHVINKYEMGVKNPVTGEVTVQELLQIKAWLKRRTAELNIEKLMGSLLEDFKAAAPAQPAIVRPPAIGPRAGMLEVSIMDLHLGKRAWGEETGRDYDPEIAQRMFWTALEDLIAKASSCAVEEILFVCGNDFFNTDNLGRTTTQGTLQDEAIPWQQSFVLGVNLLVQAIERLRRVAKVKVVMVQGNHDTQRVFFLGSVLAARFSQTADVHVDNSPTQRKYVHYGANLIGFTHGSCERHPNLPLLMATERAQEMRPEPPSGVSPRASALAADQGVHAGGGQASGDHPHSSLAL